jgi:branched-subunit amino acid transport protein
MIWAAVLIGAAGTYSEKLLGYLLPASLLDNTTVRRITGYLPICLLSALVAVQTFSTGTTLVIDARVAGVAAAVIALMLRAPFLVVVLVAAIVTALLRASGLSE